MMSKENKKNYIEEMKKNFSSNNSVMIAQYQGLNVNELDELRKQLREKGILFKITKNRITKLAIKETPVKIWRIFLRSNWLLFLRILLLQLKYWQNLLNHMIN